MSEQRFAQLFGKRPEVWRPGLARIARAYQELDRPACHVPQITVGGTNGKGSTSAFLWLLLQVSQKKVGLFTSPHLWHFSERFLMSGRETRDDDCEREWRDLEDILSPDAYRDLSFFEIATLMALRLFEKNHMDAQIIEVGLGGRLDACNILEPSAVAIVSLGYDHLAYLGTTLPEIAAEKIAIARAGKPVFLGRLPPTPEGRAAKELIETKCRELGAPLYRVDEELTLRVNESVAIRLRGHEPLEVALPAYVKVWPDYLQHNLLIACALYHHWRGEWAHDLLPLDAALRTLSEKSPELPAPPSLLGRFSQLHAPHVKQELLIDVCHNKEGVVAFLEALRTRDPGKKTWPAAVSILRDKPYESMLHSFAEVFEPLVVFTLPHERSLTRTEILSVVPNAICVDGVNDAIKVLTHLASEAESWVSCGSVLAVGCFLEACGLDPQNISLAHLLFGDAGSVPRPG